MAIPEALLIAVTGYAIDFLGIVIIMYVVILTGKLMVKNSKKNSEPAVSEAPAPTPAPAAPKELAPGSAGEVKLYDVPDKEAAMIMAIVADKMGKPLNELRFKSIKEVKGS